MATSIVQLLKEEWVEVSTTAVYFQVPDQQDVYAVEAVSKPADGNTDIRKKINPGKSYTFTPFDGKLYMYAEDGDCEVAIDPVS